MLVLFVSVAALWGCGRGQETAGDAAAARDPAPATGAAARDPASDEFSPAAVSAADAVGAAEMKEWIGTLAADDMQGRGPGSDGDRQTRDYLARELESLGYAPGGPDGSWQQPFELVGINSQQPPTWEFSAGDETVTLEQSSEFIVASGVQREQASVENAELVFVGYGIQAPEYEWDDFKGQDLTGKVLVMLNNDPDWDPALFEGDTRLYYGRWTYKYESAAAQGAAGAIIIHTEASAGYPWQVVQTSWTGEQFELPAGEEPRTQVEGWVTEAAAGKLLSSAGKSLDELVEAARSRSFEPVPLGIRTSLTLANELSKTESANVLGLLRGSDEALADEVVLYTAHHDHLGVGTPDSSGDRIYNGARDNAAGVGLVMSIAKAFASLPERPRRSILIALVGAEEQGLLGSKYYALHPTVPPGRIAAVVNFDAPNIWGETRDVTYVGMGKSSLDQVAQAAAAHQDRTVHPDPFPDRGFFYRSDQFSLARVGVPGLYLKGGTDFVGKPDGWGREQVDAYTRQHYHQPSDELSDAWNFDGLVQDARLGFLAGLIVANQDEMPTWNPGDEFEAARQEALSALD